MYLFESMTIEQVQKELQDAEMVGNEEITHLAKKELRLRGSVKLTERDPDEELKKLKSSH